MNVRAINCALAASVCALHLSTANATPITAKQVVAGGQHACAILDDDTVKCWGDNNFGQLGLGVSPFENRGDDPDEMGNSLPTVDLGAGLTVAQLAAGYRHTCALLTDGRVKCWGGNSEGQLGLGDTADRGLDLVDDMGDSLPAVALGVGRTAVQISAGELHTCAVLDNGGVKCWGGNASGQLGIGTTFNRGDNSFEMGQFLPSVQLGAGRTAVQVDAGHSHTCAVLDNGAVKCWGENGLGQLGLGDSSDRGDAANEMGDLLPSVDVGTGRTATQIATGESHTCALLDNGRAKCWGLSAREPAVAGGSSPLGDGPNEMGDMLPFVQLGLVLQEPRRQLPGAPPIFNPTPAPVTQISAGNHHDCALIGSQLKCWGNNNTGQLGLGDQSERSEDENNMGAALAAVDLGAGRRAVEVAASLGFFYYGFTCARLDDGRIKCWGENSVGQLGVGDHTSRGVAPDEMGDALLEVDLGSR